MFLEHSKHTIALIEVGRGKRVPMLITKYSYNGTGGSHTVHHKGRDIATALKGQPVITVEVTGFLLSPDVVYLKTDTQVRSMPIVFTAVSLRLRQGSTTVQEVDAAFFSPTDTTRGILFRAAGYIDDLEVRAEAGQYQLVRTIIKADEFNPGRLLL